MRCETHGAFLLVSPESASDLPEWLIAGFVFRFML